MDFNFNIFAIILIVCGIASIALSNFIYTKGGKAVKWFTLMLLSTAVWSIAYGLELASNSLAQIVLFIKIEYLGVAPLSVAWLFFALHLSGKEKWYQKTLNVALLLAIPVATVILVWTNEKHHFIYNSIGLVGKAPFPLANLDRGTGYYIFTAYFYLLMAAGCYLIVKTFRQSDRIYKNQNNTILVAAFVPWFLHLIGLFGIKPIPYIDITPFTFIVSNFFIIVGIYRFQLFDIIPIAREKVLELMRDGFLVIDQHHRIIDYNQAVNQYFNFQAGQKIIGTNFKQVLPDQPAIIELIHTGKAGKIEFTTTNNNHTFHLEADIFFLENHTFNNHFAIVRIQDLTNFRNEAIRVQAQAQELEKLNQLKDRIFSIIAHDLRGPLVNLSEVLKMLSNEQISSDEFRDIAPTMSKDIIYTTDLLENILHWSRSQLKGFGIKKEFFNLRNLILNEINYHLPAATMKKINIIHDVFPGEMVYADVLMIQIIVRNLLNNAIKFCHEHCEIHITAVYQRNNQMLICFKDNGVGMAPGVVSKLFKNENITTRGTSNEKGTGLGLLVCRDFVNRNDGHIAVDSSEGKGAKFYITLPTAPSTVILPTEA